MGDKRLVVEELGKVIEFIKSDKLSDADISIKVEGLDKSKVLENFYLSI